MTPEYLEELADLADPAQLWRLGALTQLSLPPGKRKQLDTGVALRRHASHIRELDHLRRIGKSLLITPLSPNGTATAIVGPPPRHKKLLQAGSTCEVCGATGGQHYGNCKHVIRGVNELIGPGE